jgi:hypothetical protein
MKCRHPIYRTRGAYLHEFSVDRLPPSEGDGFLRVPVPFAVTGRPHPSRSVRRRLKAGTTDPFLSRRIISPHVPISSVTRPTHENAPCGSGCKVDDHCDRSGARPEDVQGEPGGQGRVRPLGSVCDEGSAARAALVRALGSDRSAQQTRGSAFFRVRYKTGIVCRHPFSHSNPILTSHPVPEWHWHRHRSTLGLRTAEPWSSVRLPSRSVSTKRRKVVRFSCSIVISVLVRSSDRFRPTGACSGTSRPYPICPKRLS